MGWSCDAGGLKFVRFGASGDRMQPQRLNATAALNLLPMLD
jgi:hypothetical protein